MRPRFTPEKPQQRIALLQRFYRRKLAQKGFGKASVAAARKLGIRLWINSNGGRQRLGGLTKHMLRDQIEYNEFCRRFTDARSRSGVNGGVKLRACSVEPLEGSRPWLRRTRAAVLHSAGYARHSQFTTKLTGKVLTDALTHFGFSEDGTDRVLQMGAVFGSAWGPPTTTTTPIEAPTST